MKHNHITSCNGQSLMFCRRLALCFVILLGYCTDGFSLNTARTTVADITLCEVAGLAVKGQGERFCVWDWSDKETGNEVVDEMTLWGDSLVSLWMRRSPLSPLGVRRDYIIGDDGLRRLCREDRSLVYHDTLPVPVFLSGLLTSGDSVVSPVAKTGRMYQRYNMSATGISVLKNIARGVLILPTNDTLYNVVMTQSHEALSHYSNDGTAGQIDVQPSLENLFLTESVDEYMWFAEGIGYPVARMTRRQLTTPTGDERHESESFLCIPSMQSAETRELISVKSKGVNRVKSRRCDGDQAGADNYPPRDIAVKITESTIDISAPALSNSHNELVLTDISGRVYYSDWNFKTPVSIERSSLPSGDYILWINAGGEYTIHKILNR